MQLIFFPAPVATISRRFASRRDAARVDPARRFDGFATRAASHGQDPDRRNAIAGREAALTERDLVEGFVPQEGMRQSQGGE